MKKATIVIEFSGQKWLWDLALLFYIRPLKYQTPRPTDSFLI